MDRATVIGWVSEYERVWRAGDTDALAELFTEDVSYRVSPYEPSAGRDELAEFWGDDDGRKFNVEFWPVAVEGSNAAVRVDVEYLSPRRQEYSDLWLLRFSDDGRVEDFEEWVYWPGRSYSAVGDGA